NTATDNKQEARFIPGTDEFIGMRWKQEMPALAIRDGIPDGFLSARAADIVQILPEPTLLHLSGRRREPLFVSILLHGNEDVGLVAVQKLLTVAGGQTL